MSEEALRRQLYDSFKNRAILYYLIYDEIRRELGPEKAEAILGRAIYRRGTQKGQEKYAQYGPDDLAGLQKAFLDGIPDEGRMFQPEVIRGDAQGLDIKFHGCPLRDAWQEAGLPDDEVATICRIAARVDNGTFEAAGFRFSADTWQPGGDGCCCLHIRPGKPST
ncbi:MAG: L-2-amino-thiazoline-4-carboxylic acid hydrolase [Pirellulales bacterium]|nr:L-2-amino-thiazoline-4-carboxylic acid hydrolase [Pirellulales bacterium]